jgi:hypothetical protein
VYQCGQAQDAVSFVLPTIWELIGLVDTNAFLGTDLIGSWASYAVCAAMRQDRSGAGDLASTRETIEKNRRSFANLADSNEIERGVPDTVRQKNSGFI